MQTRQNFEINGIIGKSAMYYLQQSPEVAVWGNTSNGIFLQSAQSKIVFLTSKPHLGPVNIILKQDKPIHWNIGDTIQLNVGEKSIIFRGKNNSLTILIDEVWQTTNKPRKNIPQTDQLKILNQAAKQLSLLKNEQGFSSLLIPFVTNDMSFESQDAWVQKSWEIIMNLKKGLLQKNLSTILDQASNLIGSGRGLTPSGDDLLTGLFFMKKRWFEENEWINSLESDLVDQFNHQTTAVSTTLFECALQGEADARIQEMSDVLMNADIPFSNQAINLARWGNSSGADVFLGMLLAIQCFQSE